AVQLDQVDVHSLGGEVLACRGEVLGGDAQPRAAPDHAAIVEAAARRDHHAAARDAQIERLVEAFAAVLGEHVAPGDADVGAAVLDVGGSVARSHHHQPQVAAVGGEDELARGFGISPGPDADAREQRSGLVEDPPLRKRNAYARHVKPSGYSP